MMARLHSAVVVFLCLLLLPTVARAEKWALLIGNARYESFSVLRNPTHDSGDLAERLVALGFRLVGGKAHTNLGRDTMLDLIAEFGRLVRAGDVALFFYAGHGAQHAGQNYLVPVDDRRIVHQEDLPDWAVAAEAVQRRLEASGVTALILFDACRNAPLPSRNANRQTTRGMARMQELPGSYIAFATAPGTVADDGQGRNSPFTTALLAALQRPARSIDDLFTEVRGSVHQQTGGRQTPWTTSSLLAPFSFAPGANPPPRPVSGPQLVSDRWEDLAAGKTWELPVLGNDRAASGGALRVVSVSGGGGARVEVKGDGSAVLLTAPSGMGEVRFRYRAQESGGGEGEAEVVVALAVPVGPVVPSGIELVSGVYGQPGSVFRDRGVGLDMVVLPRGAYQRGSPDSGAAKDSERFDIEGPVRTVEIGYTLAVGRTEVTVGQYRRFVAATGRQHPGGCYVLVGSEMKLDSSRSWESPGFAQGDDHPVSCVSWQDAQAYIAWLNGQLGGVQVASSGSDSKGYRLLSESEWEYAARGVTSAQAAYQRRYWGDSAEAGCLYANGADLSAKDQFSGWTTSSCRDGFVYTAPVGSLKANAFGLHDMLGNVWEWTQDCSVDNYGGAPVDGTAVSGPDSCPRVLRGGSWDFNPRSLRSALRSWLTPDVRSYYLGFRLARMLSN